MLIDHDDRLPQEDSKNDNVTAQPTHIPSATPQAQQPTSVQLHPAPKEPSTITKEQAITAKDEVVAQDQIAVETNEQLPSESHIQDPQQDSRTDIASPTVDNKTLNDNTSNSNQANQPVGSGRAILLDHPDDDQPIHKLIPTPQVRSDAPEPITNKVNDNHAIHDSNKNSGKVIPIDYTKRIV